MAKKSHTGHRPMPQQAKGAARKPQTPGGAASSATLVRAPGAQPAAAPETPDTPSASNVVADTAAPTAAATASRAAAATASRPATATSERKAAVAERPAAPKAAAGSAASKPAAKPAAPAARPQATTPTREQNQRLARARATERARHANLISAEHYAYVLGDLKLIVALAVGALVVLIALTFVLPH